ncbi:cupin domain-containing protein [Paenibacillus agricola]|uniref:Cupin domain-containing protein n=1 Tax=Paenibacillus agricola TaxID=2716264 RepID=A0ABX0IZB1_9BACL|nr:cupin domain-containing protein [Paenibacillus agricola]NHN28896.1 cupin domain-containing protein [Paenibacillus agricola]
MLTTGMLADHFENCPVHKISAQDSNKFIILCDGEKFPFVSVVEIFDEGGKTPPNEHSAAYEYFYVIAGEGKATVDGEVVAIRQGSYFVVSPGHMHEVENTGVGKLYVLTTLIPDENFTALIRSGPEASLDDEDIRVLTGLRLRGA